MMFVLHHRPPPTPFIIREPKPPATTQKIVAGYHWSWISKERGLFLTETPDSHPGRPTTASAHPARDGGRRPGASPKAWPGGTQVEGPSKPKPGDHTTGEQSQCLSDHQGERRATEARRRAPPADEGTGEGLQVDHGPRQGARLLCGVGAFKRTDVSVPVSTAGPLRALRRIPLAWHLWSRHLFPAGTQGPVTHLVMSGDSQY